MALAKFSKFKKERAVIKEARLKEKKVAGFKKALSEKLKEMGKSSVADLSEEQINTLLNSLATTPVNEDRMREIEADGIAAGTPRDAGEQGEIAKKHTFHSPQSPDEETKAKADDMQAEEVEVEVEEIGEAKKAVKEDEDEDEGVEDVEKGDEESDKGSELEDKGDKKVDSEDDEEKADHYKGAVKSDDAEIEKDKDEIKDLKKDVKYDKEEEDDADESVKEAEVVEADEIKSDKEFDDYADTLLKKAHPGDFDEKIAKKVKDGLKKKYDGDYGAMVGALSSGFGG